MLNESDWDEKYHRKHVFTPEIPWPCAIPSFSLQCTLQWPQKTRKFTHACISWILSAAWFNIQKDKDFEQSRKVIAEIDLSDCLPIFSLFYSNNNRTNAKKNVFVCDFNQDNLHKFNALLLSEFEWKVIPFTSANLAYIFVVDEFRIFYDEFSNEKAKRKEA